MKKHTMQEIADFFGCYIAKDECNRMTMFDTKNKPQLVMQAWTNPSYVWQTQKCAGNYAFLGHAGKHNWLFLDADNHNYRELVEPKTQEEKEAEQKKMSTERLLQDEWTAWQIAMKEKYSASIELDYNTSGGTTNTVLIARGKRNGKNFLTTLESMDIDSF